MKLAIETKHTKDVVSDLIARNVAFTVIPQGNTTTIAITDA